MNQPFKMSIGPVADVREWLQQMKERIGSAALHAAHLSKGSVRIGKIHMVFRVFCRALTCYYFNSI